MDGVAEQGDVAGLPVLERNGTGQSKEKGLFRLCSLSKGRQRRIPVVRQLHGRPLEIGAVHSLQVHLWDGELFPAAKYPPHQIILGVLEAQARPELRSSFPWRPPK